MKKLTWILWLLLSAVLAGYFIYTLTVSEDKSELLIGEASHGHFQIEMACTSCHTDPFGGPDVIQDACTNCHAQELEAAHDSHPRKKFTDPREAYRLEIIDARYCVSCHTEHQQEQTRAMGVTLPDDYCYHCHSEISNERDSHKDLPFDSCASAGCHNYHDNRALYESFLVKNADQPWLKDLATITNANHAKHHAIRPNTTDTQADRSRHQQHPEIVVSWLDSKHAKANVDCKNCHQPKPSDPWLDKPGTEQCQSCHQQESQGFFSGKHGMRLSPSLNETLTAITPGESTLPFTEQSQHAQQGCNSCHSAHNPDRQFAAVEACLNCHNDQHSLNFIASPHGKLWQQAQATEIPQENAVTCASCHMPRISNDEHGTNVDRLNNKAGKNYQPQIYVEHNQNLFLRPNEKMIRPICMQCHSLEFSIDSLADELLIKNNFSGQAKKHIESIDWAIKREAR